MTSQPDLAQFVTPRITPEQAGRLKLVRLMLYWDQATLAQKLGISQQKVSLLESGRVSIIPINLLQFQTIFPEHWQFILSGKNVCYTKQLEIGHNFWLKRHHKIENLNPHS